MTDQHLSRTAARAVEQRARILELLKRLSPERIADLDRRARFLSTPDGFPTGGGGGRSSGEVSRPTEQATIARLDPSTSADPVGAQIRLVFGALAEAAGVLVPVDRWLGHLDAYGDQAMVRDTSRDGDCKCCDRVVTGTPSDRLRGGYCDACRKAYERWAADHPVGGDPAAHRLEFETQRRAKLAAHPELAPAAPVVACPHRCCSLTYPHEHWHEPASCPNCRAAEGVAS